VVKEFLP